MNEGAVMFPQSAGMTLRIGVAYDLRSHYVALGYTEEQTAELDSPATIDAILGALSELGYLPFPIGNAGELARKLVDGERWDLVFNLSEGLHGLGREALVPALLDAHRIPYTFSDPCVMAISLHKGFTKHILRDAGIATPDFVLLREPAEIDSVDLPFPLFAKPVAEGTGKGIDGASRIETSRELHRRCGELLERYHQPVLVERYLPGREFTVGIIGTGTHAVAIGTLEIIPGSADQQGVYGYLSKERCEQLVRYRSAAGGAIRQVEDIALEVWNVLGCRDAGRVDVRMDENGSPQVLEVNPLAGLHPTHSDLPMIASAAGMSYRELIGRIVESALSRIEAYPAEGVPGTFSSNSILV